MNTVRLLENRDHTRAEQIERFDAELQRRLAALDRSENISAAESRRRLAALSREHRKLTAHGARDVPTLLSEHNR